MPGACMSRIIPVLLVSFLILSALSVAPEARELKRLTVAGAADLTFALKEIAGEFEKETGYKVVLSMGSTGMLAKQIEHGAPFDVFFAADTSYIQDLAAKGHVTPGTAELYARGRIALAVRKGSGITARGLDELVSGGNYRVAIANPDHAPYGKAAMEALRSAGVWEEVRPRLVFGENVRQTLQFIQSGNAPAGIVALSVVGVPGIDYSVIPEGLHRPIDQAAAVVRRSKEPRAAKGFIRFVNGPRGRPIMGKYGFLPPG